MRVKLVFFQHLVKKKNLSSGEITRKLCYGKNVIINNMEVYWAESTGKRPRGDCGPVEGF